MNSHWFSEVKHDAAQQRFASLPATRLRPRSASPLELIVTMSYGRHGTVTAVSALQQPALPPPSQCTASMLAPLSLLTFEEEETPLPRHRKADY